GRSGPGLSRRTLLPAQYLRGTRRVPGDPRERPAFFAGRMTSAPLAPAPPDQMARIGPNAIIQLVAAIAHRWGPDTAAALLSAATASAPETLPHDMVDDREPLALVRLLLDRMGADAAAPVLHDAGVRTGRYLLAHRIPPLAQWVIGRLPRRLGL